MYYILAPFVQLTGYKKLPFAVHDLRKSRTEFLNREQFGLVYHCDGRHDIDMETLSDPEHEFFEHFIKEGYAAPCEKGTSLKPYQEYRYYENRFKDIVHWSVTGRCNYRCRHCFMSAPGAKFGHASKELCLDFISQMEECGIKNVSITGGEPLVREDFMDLVEALTDRHICISSILTNGALVDEALLEGLEKYGQHPVFQISFDGKGCHDWMRGVDGAEKKVLDTLRLLSSRGYNTSSAMALHRGNVNTIRETVLLLGEVGCGALKINEAYPSGEWAGHPEYFLTQEETFQAYLDYIPRYFEDDAPIGLMLEGAFHYEPGADDCQITADRSHGGSFERLPVCASLRSMIYVGPEGGVLPCQSMINAPIFDKYPNVFETPLREILSDSTYIRDVCSNVPDFMDRNPECRVCPHAKHCCGGCRAMAVGADGGDFFAPDRRVCSFYKDGWYEKFKAAASQAFEKFAESGGVDRGKARFFAGDRPPMTEC